MVEGRQALESVTASSSAGLTGEAVSSGFGDMPVDMSSTIEEPESMSSLLTRVDARRFVLFPIQVDEIWHLYKAIQGHFWVYTDTPDSYAAVGDSTVKELVDTLAHLLLRVQPNCLHARLTRSVSSLLGLAEARTFLGYQAMLVNRHAEAMALLLMSTVAHDAHICENVLDDAATRLYSTAAMSWETESAPLDASILRQTVCMAVTAGLLGSVHLEYLADVGRAHGLSTLLTTVNNIAADRRIEVHFACYVARCLGCPSSLQMCRQLVFTALEVEMLAVQAIASRLISVEARALPAKLQRTADVLLTMLGCLAMERRPLTGDDILFTCPAEHTYAYRRNNTTTGGGIGKSNSDKQAVMPHLYNTPYITASFPYRPTSSSSHSVMSSKYSTLRGFFLGDASGYIHVRTEHRQLNGGVSLPCYSDWFSRDIPVRSTTISVVRNGRIHTFTVYYTRDRIHYPTPSAAARLWGRFTWHGELLMFRHRSSPTGPANRLVNIRSSDGPVVDMIIGRFFRRRGAVD
ncbi:hypothetical protein FA95DRAFT_1603331 [Auriscalpium vulgare]|uniref:Uncharacterized protein n=1 Tax=Auriscalpium vulgare TaxID=40419 RepID=A0ACB8S2B8_9AGAM|nr:hypothetical protein FA95DRAFT_1603331 [Auriscalpium vulgare]